jgi:type 1 glutamine amidotransferase
MTGLKKAILIGDNEYAKYHPMKGVDEELMGILMGVTDLECTEDYGIFDEEKLTEYSLVISYVDSSIGGLSKSQAAALLSYVVKGGGFLAIHNGIFIQNHYELAQLVGGKFTGHPPYTRLEFEVTEPNHPVMKDVNPFALEDEPYRFEYSNMVPRTVLMRYKHDEALWDAAWAHEFGLGRVVYLAPGHSAQSFKNPEYRKVIANSAKWVMKSEA